MEFDKGLIGGSTVLMVLSLLKESDRYGYELIRELERRSEQAFQFREGTLYPVLHRMENQGYIKSDWRKAESGKARKYYAITDGGLRQLEAERKQWQQFTESVGRVIGGHGYAVCHL